MENDLFIKLLDRKDVKEVPLSYVIVVFSAIQDIIEQKKEEEKRMEYV